MTKNVTFWSYKGGVGRTLALVNTAFQLARQGKKVLIWEMDLEAPGLMQIPIFHELGNTVRGGVVDILTRVTDRLDTIGEDLARYVVRYRDAKDPLLTFEILPAGAPNSEYFKKYTGLNWSRFFGPDASLGYFVFESMQGILARENQPDFILIDSRTGVTDLSGVCTVQLPDTVVLVFNLSHQGIEGMASVKRAIDQRSRDTRKPGLPIQTILVASHVPTGSAALVQRRVEELRRRELEPAILIQLQEDLQVEELIVSRDADTSENFLKFETLARMLRDPYLDYLWRSLDCGRSEQPNDTDGAANGWLTRLNPSGDGATARPLSEALKECPVWITGDAGRLGAFATWLTRHVLGGKLPGRNYIWIPVHDLEVHIARCLERNEPATPTLADSPRWIANYLAAAHPRVERGFFDEQLASRHAVVLLDGSRCPVPLSSTLRLMEEAAATYPEALMATTGAVLESRPSGFTPFALATSQVPGSPRARHVGRPLRVFLSGTLRDLGQHREAARHAIMRAGCYPVGLESFTAQDMPPVDICLREVDGCDALVVLVAHRYGWKPEGHQRQEYHVARVRAGCGNRNTRVRLLVGSGRTMANGASGSFQNCSGDCR